MIMHPDYPNNIVIRVGEGQSKSGKILDRGTHWYNLVHKEEAIQYALETNRNIYISKNNQKYQQYSIDKFKKLLRQQKQYITKK